MAPPQRSRHRTCCCLFVFSGSILLPTLPAGAQECPCSDSSGEACRNAKKLASEIYNAVGARGDKWPWEVLAERQLLDKALQLVAFWKSEVTRIPTAFGFVSLAQLRHLLGDSIGAIDGYERALSDGPPTLSCPLTDEQRKAVGGSLSNALAERVSVSIEAVPVNTELVGAYLYRGTHPPIRYVPVPNGSGQYWLNPGRQMLQFQAPGFSAKQAELAQEFCSASGGKSCPPVRIHLDRKPQAPTGIKLQDWMIGGIGAIVSLGGIAYGSAYSWKVHEKNAQLQSMCPGNVCANDAEVGRYRDVRSEALDARTNAIIGWSAGSVAAVSTGIYLVLRLSGTDAENAKETPSKSMRIHVAGQSGSGHVLVSTTW